MASILSTYRTYLWQILQVSSQHAFKVKSQKSQIGQVSPLLFKVKQGVCGYITIIPTCGSSPKSCHKVHYCIGLLDVIFGHQNLCGSNMFQHDNTLVKAMWKSPLFVSFFHKSQLVMKLGSEHRVSQVKSFAQGPNSI